MCHGLTPLPSAMDPPTGLPWAYLAERNGLSVSENSMVSSARLHLPTGRPNVDRQDDAISPSRQSCRFSSASRCLSPARLITKSQGLSAKLHHLTKSAGMYPKTDGAGGE